MFGTSVGMGSYDETAEPIPSINGVVVTWIVATITGAYSIVDPPGVRFPLNASFLLSKILPHPLHNMLRYVVVEGDLQMSFLLHEIRDLGYIARAKLMIMMTYDDESRAGFPRCLLLSRVADLATSLPSHSYIPFPDSCP